MQTAFLPVSRACAGAAISVGGLVFVGWAADIPVLKSILPGLVAVKANTAVGFILAGVALALKTKPNRASALAANLCAGSAALIGLLTLGEYAFGWNLGIDQLLFREPVAAVETSHPGRMALPTALNFLVLGTALLLLGTRSGRPATAGLTAIAAAVAGAALVGYLFDVRFVARFGPFTPIAVPTALMFLVLCGGVLLAACGGFLAARSRTIKTAGFVFALALLFVMGSAVLRNTLALIQNARRVEHTRMVIGKLDATLSALRDIETGTRGYVIAGNRVFLEPYLPASTNAHRLVQELGALTSDDPAQQSRLDRLAPLIERKIANAASNVALRERGDTAGATAAVASGEGKRIMDDIRGVVDEMTQAEERRLQARQARAEASTSKMLLTLGLGLLVSVAVLVAVFVLLRREIAQREQAEAALRRSEENLAVTLHSIGDAVLATDTAGRVTRLNSVAEELTGWTQAEALGRPVDEVFTIVNEETRQPAVVPVAKVLASGELHGLANHTVVIARDGTERPIADSAAPIRDRDGRMIGVVLVFRDVTIEKQAERAIAESERRLRAFNEQLDRQVRQRTAELSRSNRALRVLGECNQALVRAQSEQDLLDWICRAIVEHGGYRMCWVGYAEADAAKTVRPMAHAGFEQGFLEQAAITWADTERGRGPSGLAIRSREPAVFNDMVDHPDLAPWREASAQRGYASAVGLPLKVDAATLGALVICAADPNAFRDEELKLLTELADDLSFGIAALRARAARQQAEAAVRREREFSQALLQSAADGVVACDANGTLVLFNRTAREWHGMDALALPPGEWARHYDLYEADGQTPLPTERIPLMRAFQGEIVRDAGMAIVAKGQPARYVLASGGPFFDATGRKLGAVVVMRDITERQRAETKIQEQLAELQRSYDLMLGREERVQELKREVNQLLERQGEPARYPSEAT
jgi:PAS domain S-box-containing protein